MTKNGKKKIPQNYTVVAWGWDGGGLLVLTGGNCLPLYRWMVLTRGPGHGYLKMDLTRNPYLGEWQHTVKKRKEKKITVLVYWL